MRLEVFVNWRQRGLLPNLVDLNQIWTIVTLSWSIWHQTEFRLLLNQSEKCNCNQDLVLFNVIQNQFLYVWGPLLSPSKSYCRDVKGRGTRSFSVAMMLGNPNLSSGYTSDHYRNSRLGILLVSNQFINCKFNLTRFNISRKISSLHCEQGKFLDMKLTKNWRKVPKKLPQFYYR